MQMQLQLISTINPNFERRPSYDCFRNPGRAQDQEGHRAQRGLHRTERPMISSFCNSDRCLHPDQGERLDRVCRACQRHSGALNASTEDVAYIRAGTVTEKGRDSAHLLLNGNRCVGDPAQGFPALPQGQVRLRHWVVSLISTSAQRPAGRRRSCCFIVASDASPSSASNSAGFCLRCEKCWRSGWSSTT